jgi:hypothetical protein
LNLNLSEPFALLKKLSYFINPIEWYVLLESVVCLGVHDPIRYSHLKEVNIDFTRANFSATFEASNKGGKYGQINSTLNIGCKQRKGGIPNSKEFSHTTFVIV